MSLEARLLDFGKKDGLEISAAEFAIYRGVYEGTSKPTFMFSEYTPTVSIGNSQSYALDVDHEACERNGVSIVRRKSGGQAVYLDDGYIVFALIGPTSLFDRKRLRADFSTTIAETLRTFGIPAQFYKPDNVILTDKNKIKTIGNSGQYIGGRAILLQGSIRYHPNGHERLLETLRTNGHSLALHTDQILQVLGDVVSYAPQVSKDAIKEALLRNMAIKYGLQLHEGGLTPEEKKAAAHHAHSTFSEEHLRGEPYYPSRGVCYFFLNGNNLIPSMRGILPYNKPSTTEDSTEQIEVHHG